MTDWLVYAAVLIGIGGAAFMVARSPSFWIGFAEAMLPIIIKLAAKRMPPDEEAQLRELQARGASGQEIAAWDRQRVLNRMKVKSAP